MEYVGNTYSRIFVALDGSEEQDKVLARALDIASNNKAELYIGHVIDSTSLEIAGTYPEDLIPNLDKNFRKSIQPALEKAIANLNIVKIDVIVRTGRIRETLKDSMLDIIEPDIVICGARGLSSVKYAFLGSISTFLLRNSECDVLVVK